MTNVTTIQGINSLYYIEYDGKKYYLFGDVHDQTTTCDGLCDYHNYTFDKTFTYNTNCTTITALLDNWFHYNNKYNIKTNVYLEKTYTKKDNYKLNFIDTRKLEGDVGTLTTIKPKHMSWMQLTNDVFRKCLTTNKSNCPFYPYVKMHYIDIRAVDDTRISPFYINDIYHEVIGSKLNPKLEETYKMKKYVTDIISTLVYNYDIIVAGLLDPSGFNAVVNVINGILPYKVDYLYQLSTTRNDVVMYKIAAELQKLDTYMYDKVITYIYGFIDDLMIPVDENYDQDLTAIFDNFGLNVEYNLLCIELFLTKYHNIFTILSAYIMDAYVLARLLTQEGDENIIYAGVAHIDIYKDFFKQLDIHYIVEHDTNYTGCIHDNLLPMYLNINKYR